MKAEEYSRWPRDFSTRGKHRRVAVAILGAAAARPARGIIAVVVPAVDFQQALLFTRPPYQFHKHKHGSAPVIDREYRGRPRKAKTAHHASPRRPIMMARCISFELRNSDASLSRATPLHFSILLTAFVKPWQAWRASWPRRSRILIHQHADSSSLLRLLPQRRLPYYFTASKPRRACRFRKSMR